MYLPTDTSAISTISNLIQITVAPVFLLAGVAGLLNVYTGRMTRIIDKLEKLDNFVSLQEKKDPSYQADEKLSKRRKFLIMRMQNTNSAIFFCTSTGFTVAMVILTIFSTSLFSFDGEILISILFILSMFFLIISLFLFLREIYFTTSFINVKKKDTHD